MKERRGERDGRRGGGRWRKESNRGWGEGEKKSTRGRSKHDEQVRRGGIEGHTGEWEGVGKKTCDRNDRGEDEAELLRRRRNGVTC